MKWLNSFQVQLYLILAVFTAALVVVIVISQQTTANTANSQVIVNLVGQQRTNALLLASTARVLANTTDAETRAALETRISGLANDFDRVETALRTGDAALGIPAIQNPAALAVLDELDRRWLTYRAGVEDFLAAFPIAQPSLVAPLDNQSLAVFTLADRLAAALNELVQQDIASLQTFSVAVLVSAVGVLVVVFLIIRRTVRSLNRLTEVANLFGRGDYSARAAGGGAVEIAQLSGVFNAMAGQIEQRITETQAALTRAERSEQVKSAFLASMSHELRTPLNAIINFTRFVAKGSQGPVNDEQRYTLNEVVDSARHLLNLINDVLDMSKIEAGSLTLFVEDRVDLHKILDTVQATGRTLIGDKPIRLYAEIDPDLPVMRGDRQRILQILLNMMSNACKFTDEGTITVRAHYAGDEVHFAIADTGPGIAPEDQPEVFEAFKQTSRGLRQGGGTGLGMPISKSLAEAHGGRIWLESQPGAGSTFYVALPVKSESLQPILVA